MIHAMIDIETLGVGKDAPLFEIGVQLFELHAHGDERNGREVAHGHWHVDIMDVMWRTGRCPQSDTLDWWRKQQYDPTVVDDRVELSEALKGIDRLYTTHAIERTWANSPSFDLVILEGHYSVFGDQPPWMYYEELDFRTMRWLAKRMGWEQPEVEVTHNALEDCRLQTRLLMEMLNV